MLLVGLTGGLGSGKSTVSTLLAERGALILDADAFARDAVRAGTPGFDRVVARFGADLVAPDGELDRAALAAIVFNDEAALRDLEAIVHPEVRRMIEQGVSDNAATDRVVVLVNPLLIEMGTHRDCDVVVVVSASPETQLERVIARGMDRQDAEARMANQLPVDERAAHADVLLDNDGGLAELERQVDRLWATLRERAGTPVR
jgi:dephospho-CoA kinase